MKKKSPLLSNTSRRAFIKSSAAIGSLSVIPGPLKALAGQPNEDITDAADTGKSIIGNYGPWANSLLEDPPSLSIRKGNWKDVDAWQQKAMEKAVDLVSSPDIGKTPKVTVKKKYQYDGLEIEELSWQLPYGRATEAILLKPIGAKGKLPGILGLHDHGGNKYFGKRKITKTSDQMHSMMKTHQHDYYEGNAWANEIAKRGYVVLVHDAFDFASRRVMFEDMTEIPWGHCSTVGKSDENPEEQTNIDIYNSWASDHENIMASSLFCSGTTWPGVFLAEDKIALNILSERSDVNPQNLGCAGLSGGGLRTVFLGGMDHRIKCAICLGFMTTWSDLILHKSYTHTWMTYAPLMPKYLDFPEILGLRAPLPTMTLNNNEDGLFTLSEMKKADQILQDVFKKAGAADNYKGGFYDGIHKFDAQMQQDAFDWFDRWLTK